MIGAALAKAGTQPLLAQGIIKTASFIFISPLLGMALGASSCSSCRGCSSGRRRGAWTSGSGGCSSSRRGLQHGSRRQ
jgi:phosphate/sulfate permease